ncbi:MAG: hypothetical protein GZ090_09460 [Oxalobacteraceae bacterium]|nr:hypothetical protein [Oxalobacteraceae bacterium]
MMNKVSYTNETRNFQHIGGVTVPPGETRDVDPSLLPDYQPEVPEQADAQGDPIAELLENNVKTVSAELANLSDDDLSHAALLEQDGQNRKSLIEAMSVETLRRATEKADKAGE